LPEEELLLLLLLLLLLRLEDAPGVQCRCRIAPLRLRAGNC